MAEEGKGSTSPYMVGLNPLSLLPLRLSDMLMFHVLG